MGDEPVSPSTSRLKRSGKVRKRAVGGFAAYGYPLKYPSAQVLAFFVSDETATGSSLLKYSRAMPTPRQRGAPPDSPERRGETARGPTGMLEVEAMVEAMAEAACVDGGKQRGSGEQKTRA
jgi:hypothetical protein